MNVIYGIKRNKVNSLLPYKKGRKKLSDESYKWIMKAVNTEKLMK